MKFTTKSKFILQIFVSYLVIVPVEQKLFANDFCYSFKGPQLLDLLDSLKDETAKIQKSDLVLSPDKKTEMSNLLNGINNVQAKPEKNLDQAVIDEAHALAQKALAESSKVIPNLEATMTKNEEVKDNPSERFLKAIQSAKAIIAKQLESNHGLGIDPNDKAANFKSIRNKYVNILAYTEYLNGLKPQLNQLDISYRKNCLAEEFFFKARLPDGHKYVFSNCIEVAVKDHNAVDLGGPVPENECRRVLNCNSRIEKEMVDDYFKGFSSEWVLNCKKQDGKCIPAEDCGTNLNSDNPEVQMKSNISKPKSVERYQ